MNVQTVRELIAEESFRWQMRFDRGEMRAFFAPGPHSADILSERMQWLKTRPDLYAVLPSEALPLLDETIALAAKSGALNAPDAGRIAAIAEPYERCLELGRTWEADFALLGPSGEGPLLLRGGVVCFPTAWSLPEKTGKPMQAIHTPVPLLNESIGRQIDLFLSKIKPGVVWLRSNWGLVRTPELNQHPERRLPRLTSPVRLEEAFLRVERQSLMALPETSGVLFGIRIEQLSLAEVHQDGEATRKLIHSLNTMDDRIAAYKGFGEVRTEIIRLLEGTRVHQT